MPLRNCSGHILSHPARVPIVAALSLVFTRLFFIEYLSPFRRVHIPFDLLGYHYTLVDYAFLSLKAGRFPEWDWTIYCGQTFVGNIQAALFYPPTWLLFAVNVARPHVSYQSLQVFVIAHVWLAFLLCYVWLTGRRLKPLASVLGAGVYAYSGYMLLQLQHQGLVAGYAWFPLGFWGIDEAASSNRWRPLWKVVAASALCFLAGYPPTWFVFAVCMGTYALFSHSQWKVTIGTVAALAASLGLGMIQLLPTLEATALKDPEVKYGTGIRAPAFFLSYPFPNFFDFGPNVSVHTNPGKEYLYLGAPAIFGLMWLLRRRKFRDIVPFLAVGIVCFILVNNPFGLVWEIVRRSAFLVQICRDWYFLAGLTAAVAPLAAYGLDDFLRRPSRPSPPWLAWLCLALLAAWSFGELVRWLPGGSGFAAGWRSVSDPAITLVLFALGIYVVRGQKEKTRLYLATGLLVAIGIDYKVFGTSKRFNAEPKSGQEYFSSDSFPAMEDSAYAQIRAHEDSRILVDRTGPSNLGMRHYNGLRSPQGFDPLFTTQYRRILENAAQFQSPWEFQIEPDQEDLLRLLGVRYFVTSENGPLYARYLASPHFQMMGPEVDYYYKVFEYRDARPAFGWESDDSGTVERVRWTPEEREFVVHSAAGGLFALKEQFSPSWQAFIDGRRAPLEHWKTAFQAVSIEPGEHRVLFRFHSRGLRLGAWISLASLLLFVAVLARK
jgi:hypothetical protein